MRVLDRRIAVIKDQRIKWAEQTADDAVPRDVARAKQTDLAEQLVALQSKRGTLTRLSFNTEQTVRHGIEHLRRTPDPYASADPGLRRAYNQAWYDHITIDDSEGRPCATSAQYDDTVGIVRNTAHRLMATVPAEPGRQNANTPNSVLREPYSTLATASACDISTAKTSTPKPIMAYQN